MAFSYSDKNFTVVGNLCFVHIYSEKTALNVINIPHAIVDRMLIPRFKFCYVSATKDFSGDGIPTGSVDKGVIRFDNLNAISYVNFSFPIDSNK